MSKVEVYSKEELEEIDKKTVSTEMVFEGKIYFEQKDKDGNVLVRDELTEDTYRLILELLQNVMKEYIQSAKKDEA